MITRGISFGCCLYSFPPCIPAVSPPPLPAELSPVEAEAELSPVEAEAELSPVELENVPVVLVPLVLLASPVVPEVVDLLKSPPEVLVPEVLVPEVLELESDDEDELESEGELFSATWMTTEPLTVGEQAAAKRDKQIRNAVFLHEEIRIVFNDENPKLI
jgi:hypothetical protein